MVQGYESAASRASNASSGSSVGSAARMSFVRGPVYVLVGAISVSEIPNMSLMQTTYFLAPPYHQIMLNKAIKAAMHIA